MSHGQRTVERAAPASPIYGTTLEKNTNGMSKLNTCHGSKYLFPRIDPAPMEQGMPVGLK